MRIPGFEIAEKLYESKSTLVFRGRRVENDQPVVLKVLKPEAATADRLARLRHEFHIISKLNLPGVIKAYNLEPYQGSLVMVEEDIGGTSLDLILGHNPMVSGQSLLLGIRLAGILGSIHQQQITHKDINPSHIIWNPASGQLRLIGFSLADELPLRSVGLQPPAALEGNLAYISPEQTGRMNRTVDYRSDMYSLGVVLYELLTGSVPFVASEPLELVYCHLARQPVPPSEVNAGVPAVISRIVMKLLAKTPEERYQTAWGLQADLEECLLRLADRGVIDPFPLGRKDISKELRIPQKIYDRREEIATLQAAFVRAAEGATGLLLVAGYAGIGKTSLVREIYWPITVRRGYFITGKFDQYLRDRPYSAVVIAFKDLMRQLLGESNEAMAAWREKLLAALGVNGQVIIDVIPEVELIIGPQPPVPQVSSTESQNRFNLVFLNFVQVFCRKEHPLVVFLDDLQWIDPASLKLIDLMLSDPDMHHLLIIGAYRDNEVSVDHPLIRALEDLRKRRMPIYTITLGPLSPECVNQIIADALQQNPAAVTALSNEVAKKTGGNPFFIHQLLSAMQNEGLLCFDREHASWCWHLDGIRAMPVTDNVIDLVIKALRVLPAASLQILSLAACAGSRFTLSDLATITKRTSEEVYSDLLPAIQAGLVVSSVVTGPYMAAGPGVARRGDVLNFLHDRVQQAAMSMLEAGERKATHLQIGRLLLANTPEEGRGERIFEIVDHLNEGLSLIDDPGERLEIARLNLTAARKAKDATAWDAARRYSSLTLELLPADAWESEYGLTFAAYRDRAECEFLTGRHAFADEIFREAVRHAISVLDKAEIYNLRMKLYQVAGRYAEGALLGQEALRLFGVEIPLDEEGNRAATQAELAAIRKRMGTMPIKALADLPIATDPGMKAVMSLLMNMCPCVYIGMPIMFYLLPLTMISYSLRYGNTEESSYGYSVNGFMQISVFDDSKAAYEFSKVALELNQRFNDRKLRGTLLHLHGDHFNYWTNHISTDFPWLEKGFKACLEVGDLMYSSYIAFEIVWQAFERGDHPLQVIELSKRYADFARRINNEAVYETIRMQQRFMQCLLGETGGTMSLEDGEFGETASLEKVTQASFGCGIEFFHVAKLILYYLYRDYSRALQKAEAASQMLVAISAMPAEAAYYFYYALTLAAIYPDAKQDDREKILAQLERYEDKISRWAVHCPANFLYKHLLVQAEKARILSRNWDAMALYNQAIASARANGYVQYEALANELAGEFWLANGQGNVARLYLAKAFDCYRRWGSTAKAEDLRHRHPGILATEDGLAAVTSDMLDLASAMKASQAISSQIVPGKLLETLIRIVIENAGAERGVLLREQDTQLVIEAEGSSEKEEITTLLSIPLKGRQDLPNTIINYVQRTHESVVLGNASAEGKFTKDPYILDKKPKSILCLPILRQKALTGILYLENNLATNIFTPHRLRILEIICSQAAISMENARLYTNLEKTVGELKLAEHALRTSQQQLQAIMDNSPAVIYVKDVKGRYILVNRRFEELFHVSRSSIAGKRDYDLFSREFADAFYANDMKVIRSGKPVELEENVPQEDGLHIYISIKYPLYGANGGVHAVCGISTDITDRKRAEMALTEAKARADMYLDLMGHDISNMNQIGIGYLELAMESLKVTGEKKELLTKPLEAFQDSSRLIDNVKKLQRAMAGEMKSEKVDSGRMLMEAISQYRSVPGRDITINYIPVGGCIVLANDLLVDVFANIIGNSIKHSAGSLVIDVNIIRVVEGGRAFYRVTLDDNGPGIPDDLKPRLFTRFEKGKTRAGGRGLGLSLVKALVDHYHGRVWAEDRVPGDYKKGSRFVIMLPAI